MILIALALIFALYYGVILILSEVTKRINENKKAEHCRKRFRKLMSQY